jgi:hypothetical protein
MVTLFHLKHFTKFLNITDIYPDIVTGAGSLSQFNFSSPIDKYLFITFSEGVVAFHNQAA